MACLFEWQLPPEAREETVWWFLTLSDWTKARPSPMTQMPNWQDCLYDDLNTLSSNLPSPCRRSAHMWSTSFSTPETRTSPNPRRDTRSAIYRGRRTISSLPPQTAIIKYDPSRRLQRRLQSLSPSETTTSRNHKGDQIKSVTLSSKHNLSGSIHLRLLLCYWSKSLVHKGNHKIFQENKQRCLIQIRNTLCITARCLQAEMIFLWGFLY